MTRDAPQRARPALWFAVAVMAALLCGCAAPPGATPSAEPVRTVAGAGTLADGAEGAGPRAAAPTPASSPLSAAGYGQHGAAPHAPSPMAQAEPEAPHAVNMPTPPPGDGEPIERGRASWYGGRFHGRRTASGERYDMHALTAAHKTLPFGTLVRVKSLVNGREVHVRINDRGPFVRDRIIDLSRAAAQTLGLLSLGHKEVELLWAGGVGLLTARPPSGRAGRALGTAAQAR